MRTITNDMKRHIYAFVMGVREHRDSLTLNLDDGGPLDATYDRGRAIMHRIFGGPND